MIQTNGEVYSDIHEMEWSPEKVCRYGEFHRDVYKDIPNSMEKSMMTILSLGYDVNIEQKKDTVSFTCTRDEKVSGVTVKHQGFMEAHIRAALGALFRHLIMKEPYSESGTPS